MFDKNETRDEHAALTYLVTIIIMPMCYSVKHEYIMLLNNLINIT